MLRIRWVDDTRPRPPFMFDDDFFRIQAVYDPECNEIVLVRWNIHSRKALVRILFHEFLHVLVYHLRLPRKLNQVIDNIDLRLQVLNGRRIDRAWGFPRYKKPKET